MKAIILGIIIWFISMVVMIVAGMMISAFCKLIKIRPIACCVINVVMYMIFASFSGINWLYAIVTTLIYVYIVKRRSAIMKGAKQPNRCLEEEFDTFTDINWAVFFTFAMFMPIFLNMNVIFGMADSNIFSFYFTAFPDGINNSKMIKYVLISLPISLIAFMFEYVKSYGNNALIDLDKVREEEEEIERKKQEYIQNMNPDLFMDDEKDYEEYDDIDCEDE